MLPMLPDATDFGFTPAISRNINRPPSRCPSARTSPDETDLDPDLVHGVRRRRVDLMTLADWVFSITGNHSTPNQHCNNLKIHYKQVAATFVLLTTSAYGIYR